MSEEKELLYNMYLEAMNSIIDDIHTQYRRIGEVEDQLQRDRKDRIKEEKIVDKAIKAHEGLKETKEKIKKRKERLKDIFGEEVKE